MPSLYSDSDLLPISALQHLIYCGRQCALIHNEQQWAENRLTVEGQNLHEKAHDAKSGESRPGIRITRSLPLRSFRLGLIGVADVVEFRVEADDPDADPRAGLPLPVEYKRGKPKKHDADRVQLCAQALCLEEMLARPVTEGRLFYGKTRRRDDVVFDDALRQRTEEVAVRLRELIDSRQTPPARYEKAKCERCSLIGLCMPKQIGSAVTASERFSQTLRTSLAGEGDDA